MIEPILPVRCQLGEGPLWHPQLEMLYWLDILQSTVHTLHPASGTHNSIALAAPFTSLTLQQDGGFIATTFRELVRWDGTSSTGRAIAAIGAEPAEARCNDAAIAPDGSLWFGTMNPGKEISRLYRLDPDLTLMEMDGGMTISNGMGWSPDASMMYFTDSQRHVIYRYRYHEGVISAREVWVETEDHIDPDGLTVDAEGYVWGAQWNGGRVIRYTPQGEIDRVIDLPTRYVTSLTFGGKNLKDLYITSAWDNEGNRRSDPTAGGLFRVRVEVPGLPDYRFLG